MKASLANAVERIKDAGFSHIKVELEGDIGRDGERYCDDCDGDGNVDCSSCEGEGYIETGQYTRINGEPVLGECNDCYGEGREACNGCDGRGNMGDFTEVETCDEWMKDYVPQEVRDRLVYGRFYEDGSVDSEFTFTVHMDHVEDVLVWMNAFKALADEIGSGIDVSDAGLHIALLPEESNGNYPASAHTLNGEKLANFTSEMNKLMPALFFLASSGHQSRNLEYRQPRVDDEKFCAISHGSGHSGRPASVLEFRVFETCYRRPEAFYDYVKTIANCIKFYADPSLKVAKLGKEFGFNDGEELSRLYNTPEQLRILNATVKHLKPADKSYKELKKERGIDYTIKSLSQNEKGAVARLKEEYKQYRANWEHAWERPLTDDQEKEVINRMSFEGSSRRTAEAYVRGIGSSRLQPITEFIRNNLPRQQSYEEMVAV